MLPKVELHLHLEGSMRSETVREMSMSRLGSTGPLEEGWEKTYYTYTDFGGFLAQLTPRVPFRPDEYARVARECFEDQAALKDIYLEVSFDVPVRQPGDHSRFWPIVEALEEERLQAQERLGIRINYIGGLMRTMPEVAVERTQLLIEARDRGMGIVGMDLHGDERVGTYPEMVEAYQLARANDMGLRVHAGEALGPESMWEAIEVLGTHRIAHGLRAVEDPRLVERLLQGDIALEICPTSNVRTAIVPSIQAHPVHWLFRVGVPVAIGSDDPLPFFTDVEREYRVLIEAFDFTAEDFRLINHHAARAAFLPDWERAQLIARIDREYDAACAPLPRSAS